jgi:hypothetical protein
VAWFDVVAPDDFARVTAEALKARLHLTSAPNLTYLRGVLWFTLLGLTLRYCQASLNVEREYKYVNRIEKLLGRHVHPEFGREGAHYAATTQPFRSWTHAIYAYASPLLLVTLVVARTIAEIPAWRQSGWPPSAYFETLVAAAIVISIVLYMASHRMINANREEASSGPPRKGSDA